MALSLTLQMNEGEFKSLLSSTAEAVLPGRILQSLSSCEGNCVFTSEGIRMLFQFLEFAQASASLVALARATTIVSDVDVAGPELVYGNRCFSLKVKSRSLAEHCGLAILSEICVLVL